MSIRDKVVKTLIDTLKIDSEEVNDDLAVGEHPKWDSLGHALLLVALEFEFKCQFDIDETLDMESVGDIVEIIEERFGTTSE
jgi:acyl carrier protein